MEEKAIEVRNFLKGLPEITAVIGEGAACKIYPFVAKEGTAPPFLTYTPMSAPFTKDARENGITLFVWFGFDKQSQFMAFTDTCVQVLEERYDVGVVQTFFDDTFQLLYAEIPIT